MSRTMICAAFVMLVAGFTAADDKGKPIPESPEQEIVIIESSVGDDGSPVSPEPVEFADSTIVRVTGSVRAGGVVSAKVMGSGKLLRKAGIRRMFRGHFSIGAAGEEFDVQLNVGTTTVVVTSRVPQDKALTVVHTYTFTVGGDDEPSK